MTNRRGVLFAILVTTVAAVTTEPSAAALGSSVTGRLLDDTGAPIAGVAVTATADTWGSWNIADDVVVGTAVSGSDGTFLLATSPPGPLEIQLAFTTPTAAGVSSARAAPTLPGASAADGEWLTLADGVTLAVGDVVLPDKGGLSGVVTGPGSAPVVGATVTLFSAVDPWLPPTDSSPGPTTTTDATGGYSFGPIDQGPWHLLIRPAEGSALAATFVDGYRPLPEQWPDWWVPRPPLPSPLHDVAPPATSPATRIVVPPQGAIVNGALAGGGELRLRVRRPHGEPPDGPVGSSQHRPCGDCSWIAPGSWDDRRVPLDAEGSATLRGLPPGALVLWFEWSGASWPTVFQGPVSTDPLACGFASACVNLDAGAPLEVALRAVSPCDPLPSTWYSDVDIDRPECPGILVTRDDGTLRGYDDGEFRPDDAASRQAAVVALWRWAGRPAVSLAAAPRFRDVGRTHPFRTAIEWAASTGIATGYPDGTFRPSAPLTHQALALLLWRGIGRPAASEPAPFIDLPPEGTSIAAAASWIYDELIYPGEPAPANTFGPATVATRATLAEWLQWYPELP